MRFFGARNTLFRRRLQINNRDVPESLNASPEEVARTEKASSDPSSLVRAAVDAKGLGLLGLIDQPQLVRLVRIRRLDFPDTGGIANFVEQALSV